MAIEAGVMQSCNHGGLGWLLVQILGFKGSMVAGLTLASLAMKAAGVFCREGHWKMWSHLLYPCSSSLFLAICVCLSFTGLWVE